MSHMKDGTVKPTGLESIETASSDELRELQFERLRWSIRHTYEKRRPRRKKCDIEGVHPTDLTRLEELARFPFNSKQDLRDTYPFGMVRRAGVFCDPLPPYMGKLGRSECCARAAIG